MTSVSLLTRDDRNSYCLKKVVSLLEEEGLSYKITTRPLETFFTGCYVNFPNTDITISIQTDTFVTGSNFAESAIISEDGVVYSRSLGYSNVITHKDPESLLSHIRLLKTMIDCRNLSDIGDLTSQIDLASLFPALGSEFRTAIEDIMRDMNSEESNPAS